MCVLRCRKRRWQRHHAAAITTPMAREAIFGASCHYPPLKCGAPKYFTYKLQAIKLNLYYRIFRVSIDILFIYNIPSGKLTKNESLIKNKPRLRVTHRIDCWSWPFWKLPFKCQKIAKNLTFFSKIFSTRRQDGHLCGITLCAPVCNDIAGH